MQYKRQSSEPPKSPTYEAPPILSYDIIRPDTNVWHRLQIRDPSEIKAQRNRINCMRLTSSNVNLSKTIHDWHRPLRIVLYRAIIYASFSKRTPMTATLSNKLVNNTLIASRQAYIHADIYIVHKIWQGNRHWGAVPIVYCFWNMHLWGNKSHAVNSIPLCFYLGWRAYLETMSKIRVRPYYIIWQKWGGLLRWGFGVTPAISL